MFLVLRCVQNGTVRVNDWYGACLILPVLQVQFSLMRLILFAVPEGKPVTVLTATNFPWALDEALRRRLEKRIYIPLPDFKSRKELIKINLKSIMLAPGLDIDQVARRTEGYSGDDLTNICRDASLNGMRRKIAGKNPDEIKNISEAEILEIPVMMDDFLEAIDKIQPTVSAGDVERHEKWFSEFLENQILDAPVGGHGHPV
nr:katanin p60 ATPase-containing subunit A1-like isoform X2 [Nicotiana tomentosiformis]